MRTPLLILAATLAAAPAGAQHEPPAPAYRVRYQGGGRAEQTERFSSKARIGRDGRVSVSNISGDIVVTAGGGDEVSIEAVKRTRGGADQLGSVRIDVQNRSGAVDITVNHLARNDRVSVDFTLTVPANASVDLHSVSGTIKVTGARGSVRAETVSGDITATDTPKVESAKSVSGSVTVGSVSSDGDLSIGTVSGNVVAKNVKVHALTTSLVSGDVQLTDVTCDRLSAKSVSGSVEFSGGITRGGSYDFNVHSGNVRLLLANPAGFVLIATSFSGTVRSELPLTIGGDSGGDRDRDTRRGRRFDLSHSIRATYGDGSATLTVRSFSGNIVIAKR
jgi:DUF4097 and DUF4098 domain-containing protein YvlB